MNGFAIEIGIFVVLLGLVAVLSVFAEKLRISTPIILVVTGLCVGFIPGVPSLTLKPEIVFFIFLPPLLYGAAWSTSWHEFRRAKRPITLLAVGLVIFTTTIVAWAAHTFIEGMPWAVAFLLGAIVSPPDAVAATSVTKGLGLPKRVVTILEGESLINDASGLIAYKYAIVAVTTGVFVLSQAVMQFIFVSVIGVAIGLLLAYALTYIHCAIRGNSVVNACLTLLTPFISYTVAELCHGSGVLAVVATGLYISWQSSSLYTFETRIMAYGVWETILFLLEGTVFIFIGLQLPHIVDNIEGFTLGQLIGFSLIISVVVMLIRIVWVFPGAYIPRLLSKKVRMNEPDTSWKLVSIVAWSGMRGVVSLAAALALPLTLESGQPFPYRSTILFITFGVILATLMIQGLTLPGLIKFLKITPSGDEKHIEKQARLKLANASLAHLEEKYINQVDEIVFKHLKEDYALKIDKLYNRIREENHSILNGQELYAQMKEIKSSLLVLERNMIIEMQKTGEADFEILRNLEYELDLEEGRLSLDK